MPMEIKNLKFLSLLKTLSLAALLVIGGVWFWYYLIGNPFDELALIRKGEITVGVVVDSYEYTDEGAFRDVYIYTLPNGQKFIGAEHNKGRVLEPGEEQEYLEEPDLIEGEEYHPEDKYDSVEIEYLPEKPEISRIKGSGYNTIWSWFFVKICLGGGISLVMCLSPGIYFLGICKNEVKEFIRSYKETPVE